MKMTFFQTGGWYLAGGTALALQAGHRQSVDLDFFTPVKSFDEGKVIEYFSKTGSWKTVSVSKGTVYGEFMKAKISFIAYPFFRPSKPFVRVGTVSIIAPSDIAAMKVVAISQRGKKRDFFDLYWICHNILPLADILKRAEKQYTVSQNQTHVLKSLVYFEDAEADPDPVINFKADWQMVKAFFKKEVTAFMNISL